MVTWNPPSCLAAIGLAALLSITSGCSEAYPEPGRVYEDVETYTYEFGCWDGVAQVTVVEVGGVIFYSTGEGGSADFDVPAGTSGTFRVTDRDEPSPLGGPNLVGELRSAGSVAYFSSVGPVAC